MRSRILEGVCRGRSVCLPRAPFSNDAVRFAHHILREYVTEFVQKSTEQ